MSGDTTTVTGFVGFADSDKLYANTPPYSSITSFSMTSKMSGTSASSGEAGTGHNAPALQSVGAVDLRGQYVPDEHGTSVAPQTSSPPGIEVMLPQTLPLEHGRGEEDPTGQNSPGAHASHSLVPPGLKKPALHATHSVSLAPLQTLLTP